MTLIDSHCHLPLIADDERTVSDIVNNALAAGVSHMLCVGVQMETLSDVILAAEEHQTVFATVGVHPNTEATAHEPTIDELVGSAQQSEKIVAIGETGLDYFRSEGDLEWQRQRFRTHIRAARELDKPLIIHTREAPADTLKIMREENAAQVGGVMHCFVEDWETASAAMDLGFYISFSGIVTFKTAGDLRDVAMKVPSPRILVETDSPWLAPVPKRGKTNEPAFVRYTAELLAEIRQEEFIDFAAQTSKNFHELFLN